MVEDFLALVGAVTGIAIELRLPPLDHEPTIGNRAASARVTDADCVASAVVVTLLAAQPDFHFFVDRAQVHGHVDPLQLLAALDNLSHGAFAVSWQRVGLVVGGRRHHAHFAANRLLAHQRNGVSVVADRDGVTLIQFGDAKDTRRVLVDGHCSALL